MLNNSKFMIRFKPWPLSNIVQVREDSATRKTTKNLLVLEIVLLYLICTYQNISKSKLSSRIKIFKIY
jgi:hypothetical protein